MANKLIIVISGKKMSGKSSLGKEIWAEIANRKIGKKRFIVEKSGKESHLHDTFNNNQIVNIDSPNELSKSLSDAYSIKIYSFADALKRFCIEALGLSHNQCYGSDDSKNSDTHIFWDDIPMDIRVKYSKKKRGMSTLKPASGPMTGREVMQVFGTDICRKADPNCWARATYSNINNEGYEVAIITDARFPNEITIGTEIGAKAIRLLRAPKKDLHESEMALDSISDGEFSIVVDNSNLSMQDTFKIISKYLDTWLSDYKII